MENELKQRNGCISFWLYLAIIANIVITVFYAVGMFDTDSGSLALGLGLCSILGLVNVLSCILLLRWNKIGFYMMVVSCIMSAAVQLCVMKMDPAPTIGSLFSVVIWWAILQAKKDGVSAWSQLESGWDVKHCRHLYQVFAAVAAILFVLTLVAYGQVGDRDDEPDPDDIEVVGDDNDPVAEEVFVEEEVQKDEPAEPAAEAPTPDPVKIKDQDRDQPKQPAQANEPAEPEDYDKHEAFLKMAVREGNKAFPQDTGQGIIMRRCYLDGDYLMYLAECDEDLLDMDIMNMNKNEMKKNIKDMIRSKSDPQVSYLVKLCVKAHKGIGFKYQGDTTGSTCIVKVPYSELKNLL